MPAISFATTADDYTAACTISDVFLSPGGSFVTAGANVFYSLQWGPNGLTEWTEDILLRPGGGFLQPPATGVRFKSAAIGVPASVSAYMAFQSQPFALVTAAPS